MSLQSPENGFLKTIANTYNNSFLPNVVNNPISKFFLGNAINTFSDIGTGLGQKTTQAQTQKAMSDAQNMANMAAQRAQTTTDPEEKKRLLKVAGNVYQENSKIASEQAGAYSPDVNMNPLLRGGLSGIEIGTASDMLSHPVSTVQGAYNMVRHPIDTIKGVVSTADNLIKDPGQFLKDIPWDMEHSFKLDTSPNKVTTMGNRFLASQYKNPGSVTSNPAETAGKLADYGFTSPDDVSNATDIITGKNGIANKMVARAVKEAGPIDTSDMFKYTQDLLDQGELITPNSEQKILNNVAKALGKGTTESSGIAGGDPEKLLETLRTWESKANVSTIPGTEADQIKQVYKGLSEDLAQRLFSNNGANDLVKKGLLTMGDYDTLKKISPQLAEDIKNAQDIPTLRKIQSYFVQGDKMADKTFKMANAGVNTGEAAGIISSAVSGNPAYLGISAASTQPGKKLIGETLRDVSKLNNGGSQFGVDVAGQAIDKYLGGESTTSSGEQNNNNQPYDKQHGGSINPSGSNVKYSASTPLDDGTIISETQQAQRQQALQQQIGEAKLGNPQLANELTAQYQQNETEFNSQNNLRKVSNDTKTVSNVANNTYNAIQSADPTLLNVLSKGYDGLLKEANGKYAYMAGYIKQLEDMTGVPLTAFRTKDALLRGLQAAYEVQQTKLDTAKTQFGGANGTTPNVAPVQLPSPTSQGIPSIPQNINWQQNDPKVQAIMGQ